MSVPKHTYGPTCHLARVVTFQGSKGDDDIPPLKAQFFYSSPLPIDDPLTAVPTTSGSDSRVTKHDPRPFSAYDNNALEEAWLGLGCEQDRKKHRKLKNSSLRPLTRTQAEIQASFTSEFTTEQDTKLVKEECKQCNRSLEDCACVPSKAGCEACHSSNAIYREPSDSSAKVLKAASNNINLQLSQFDSTASVPITDGSADVKTSSIRDSQKTHDTEAGNKEDRDTVHPKYANFNIEDTQHTSANVVLCQCYPEIEHSSEIGECKYIGAALETAENTRDLFQDDLLEADKLEGKVNLGTNRNPNLVNKTKKQDEVFNQGDAANDAPQWAKHSDGSAVQIKPETNSQSSIFRKYQSNEHKTFAKHKTLKDNKTPNKQLRADPTSQSASSSASSGSKKNKPTVSGTSETGTTGFPFLRAPSRRGNFYYNPQSLSSSVHRDIGEASEADETPENDQESLNVQSYDVEDTIHIHRCKPCKTGDDLVNVPVGISRLHLVKLPILQMMPIYWSPIHDISAVTRGTWFNRDTMYPVEPSVANQLEIGYRDLRPWSQTWKDELHSALEVGAAGEEKISHRIWPIETNQTDTSKVKDSAVTVADPFCAARCFHGEVAAVGTIDIGNLDGKSAGPTQITKRFPNSHVIYKDARNAFILKPSLQPSEYYGRKPFAKINKGMTVGIHVIRGFDWRAWEKLHESKKSSHAVKAEEGASVAGDAAIGKRTSCAACLEQEKRPVVTDLVMVIHGIGQKLSERVESFHFTHAINSFRRSINVELGTDVVQKVLRKDLGGVMVLPVNWRSNLSFEDGGPMKNGDLRKDNTAPDFTLKDITPDTIPAVRNLVSDVMLDIPFYMSHHKPKMIEALICEANRVYRLWCQNNPEFRDTGHVHIIAHSLGSAMALDVLSKQPTSINHMDFRNKKISTKHFEFNTRNLFFVGSPAGFFLLLNRGRLVPRRGRNKYDAEPGDDMEKGLTGEAGTFGCVAVDNLYNVMHYNDPVAYRLNAAVDPLYAATLKNAQVPSATTGLLETIGNAMRSITPGVSKPHELGVGQIAKPPVTRFPSQLEMDVHDFTREEIAEKKFFLLNDNGQIDYFLSSGGGPLEIQYFNMLSAHSSYWGSTDFTRMVVTEIGREPGKSHCLPNMKAVKAGHK